MQDKLQAEAPGAYVLLGVNEVGHEAGVPGMVEGKTLPLAQDTTETQLWAEWAVTYRDVVVLDGTGKRHGVFNLTANDLSVAANAAALEALLRAARGAAP